MRGRRSSGWRFISAAVLASMAGVAGVAGSALAGGPASASAPAAAERPALKQFLNIRAPGAPTLLPDGTLFCTDRPDGVVQMYRVETDKNKPEARTDSKMKKLSTFQDGLSGYTISPDGNRILLAAAVGGNENTQVYALDKASGEVKPLIANPKVQFAINEWMHDSRGFYYTGNDASPNDFHIYRYDFTDDGKGATTKILAKEGSWSLSDSAHDGSRVLVAQYRSISDSSVHELDVKTGQLKDLSITPKDTTAANRIVGYLPGETSILQISDIEDGKPKLHRRDLASGKVDKPIPALDAYELDGASINNERTLLAVSVNEDGYSVPHLYRLPSFEEIQLPAMEKGLVGLNQLRGNTAIFSLSNARTPGEAYVWTVPAAGEKSGPVRQLTFADNQKVDLAAFPLPELVKYTAFDGTEIPAFIFLPAGYKKGTAIPFVVNYHGGPEGQSRPGFNATIQYLLSEGYGVMQPNVRGSTGYGRAFHMMDDYKKRWDSVKDGVDAAEWLVANGYAKPGKIAAYGGSYGGFMAVATIVEDQQRLDEGKKKERTFGSSVNVVGIVNMKTFLEQTSGYRRKLREVEYGPLTDPEFLASVSSINKMDKINVPMMIAHGLNDPRVPVGEAMQLAIGLKKKGMDPVEFYAPDEGHGFAKLDNRLLFTERMVKFLDSTIKK